MPGNLPNALMVEDKVSTNAWQGPHLLKFLEPGGSVRVASGDQGWDPGGRPVWNNGGDTALLLDERGHVVARHRYP